MSSPDVPDIWFEEDVSKVIGALTVTTPGDQSRSDPDVQIRPTWASLTLGGGAGSNSDGDVKLVDRDENTTVHATAGKGGIADDPRVFVDGQDGTVMLGRKSVTEGDADVVLRPKWASLVLGGGAGSNSDGDVKLQDRDDNTRIHLSGGKGDTFGTTRVEANGRTADLTIGGNDRHGRIELVDDVDRGIGVVRTNGSGMEVGTAGYTTSFRGGVSVSGDADMGMGQVELTDKDDNTVGTVRATSEGLELTDGEGNVGLRIESGGDVKVKGGSVEEL